MSSSRFRRYLMGLALGDAGPGRAAMLIVAVLAIVAALEHARWH